MSGDVPSPSAGDRPLVSVVVATRDRAPLLGRLIDALAVQEGIAGFEVVVVDDGSTDATWAELERLRSASPTLVPVRLARQSGPAAARNAGWRRARAQLIAFTDDDCVPDRRWLAALARALDTSDIVQGRTLPNPAHASRVGPFSRTLEVTSESGYYQTCNMGYRRPVLERAGGFDERFRHPTGEDTDLAWRAREAGAGTVFAADALVLHDVRPSSFRAQLADTWRWEGVVLAVRRHPGLRQRFHRRWFWKPSHPPALCAAAGLALLVAGGRAPAAARAAGVALLVPYARYRTRVLPLAGGPRRRLAAIPPALVADLAEVVVLAAASARYRTLLL